MRELIKITCSRCGGSGRYSFNLVRGTVCFGCEGIGYRMVDAVKEARRLAAKAKRNAASEAVRERRIILAAQVRAELDAELGPFSDDEKGSYDRVCACQRKHGKTPGDIVQAKLFAG